MDAAKMRKEIEQQYPGLPFHEAIATLILGQWSRVSIHDPETYTKSMARVLAQFIDSIVIACADPAHGVATSSEKLPSMKSLHDWLSKEGARQEMTQRQRSAPPPPKQVAGPPPRMGPTLFVPEGFPRYGEMMAKRSEDKNHRSEVGRWTCVDGEMRSGIWVPLDWWEGHAPPLRTWARAPAKEVADDLAF